MNLSWLKKLKLHFVLASDFQQFLFVRIRWCNCFLEVVGISLYGSYRHRLDKGIKWKFSQNTITRFVNTTVNKIKQGTCLSRRQTMPWFHADYFFFLSQQLNVPLYSRVPFGAVGWKTLENNTSDMASIFCWPASGRVYKSSASRLNS